MNALLKLMLKGSAVSAIALTMAAVGCSDADKETETGAGGESGGGKGGTPSTGGSSTDKGGEGGAGATTPGGADAGGADAGGADAGGADAGGADAGGADAGGAGGAGGAASALSVAKFCNDLTFGTEQNPEDTTFLLVVGEGADAVTITASTGACSTADNAACKSIPLGAEVPVALFDADDTNTPLYEGVISSEDGDIWVFRTDLSEDAEPSPIAVGDAVTGVECKDITYDDAFSL